MPSSKYHRKSAAFGLVPKMLHKQSVVEASGKNEDPPSLKAQNQVRGLPLTATYHCLAGSSRWPSPGMWSLRNVLGGVFS